MAPEKVAGHCHFGCIHNYSASGGGRNGDGPELRSGENGADQWAHVQDTVGPALVPGTPRRALKGWLADLNLFI